MKKPKKNPNPQIKQVLAKDIKKGDRIELDCGHGGPYYIYCLVMNILNTSNMWDNSPELSFVVRENGKHGIEFTTHGFKPTDKLEVEFYE